MRRRLNLQAAVPTLAEAMAYFFTATFWSVMRDTPFLFFLAAVAVSAYTGGVFPGLLSALVSFGLAHYFLIEPRTEILLDGPGLFQIGAFAAVALIISWTESTRRRVLDRLGETETELKIILDQVADGVTTQDPTGQVRYANRAAAELTGYTSVEQMIKNPIAFHRDQFNLTDVEGKPISFSELPRVRAAADGDTHSLTFKMTPRATGQPRWIHLTTSPVFDKSGAVSLLVNVFRDVTGQMELMQQQKASREHLQTLLDTLPIMIFVVDRAGIVEQVNAAVLAAVDQPAKALIGTALPDLPWWREGGSAAQLRKKIAAAASGAVVRFDAPIGLPGVRLQEVEIIISPMDSDGQTAEYLVVSAVNITHRKQVEKELKNLSDEAELRRARLNAIVENVPGIVYMGTIDPATMTQTSAYVSGFVETMLGYPPERWQEDPDFWEKIIHPEDLERVQTEARDAYEKLGVAKIQFRCLTAAEEILHVEAHSTLITNQEQLPVAVVGVIMDVSQRKQAEQRLARYAHMLQQSNEELERFAYIASHDLQEPLRMVTSFLQLIEQRYAGKLDADGREFIEFAVGGAERMKQLISDLLAYSRLQRSRDEFTPVAMEGVLTDVLENLQVLIEENDALITHDRLPEIEGSRSHMMQLLQNLISNALKFRGSQPPQIHIAAARQGSNWQFSVADNGIGIAPAFQGQIFEVFKRLHPHQGFSGTGIGLAICKKIVEMHQGEIWVNSEPGKGTTFYFTLPAAHRRRSMNYETNRDSSRGG